jgi:integrase
VQYVHTTLHKALKDAVADGLVPRNVSDGLKPSTTRRHEIDPLTTEQARALLDAAKGDRLEALYVLAVHYGLRKGELLGLKWADVDLTAGVMQVRRTMSDSREEGTIEEPTKSGKGRRVELSQTAVNALKSRRKAQMEETARGGVQVAGQRPDLRHRHRDPDHRHEPDQQALQPAPTPRRSTPETVPRS